MARRRRNRTDDGFNLDSLMDALTNVVAVLILVLILVQADIRPIVVETQELKPATQEQVAQGRNRLAELESDARRLDKLLSQEDPSQEEIEAGKRKLALLEKYTPILEQVSTQRVSEAKQTEKIEEKITLYKRLLDNTPKPKSKSIEVRLPDSRPLPKGSKVYYALLVNERVHFIDPFTPVIDFKTNFEKHKTKFPFRRVAQYQTDRNGIKQRLPDRLVYKRKPIREHFKQFDFHNSRDQKHILAESSYDLMITIEPDLKNGGTSLKELKTPENQFASIIDELRFERDAVLIFLVNDDSFNAYFFARLIANKAGIPAGTELTGTKSCIFPIPDLSLEKDPRPNAPLNDPATTAHMGGLELD